MTQQQAALPAGSAHKPTDGPKKSASVAADSVNLDSESVAGEEDPGASLDMPASSSDGTVSMPSGGMKPGDKAPEETPGTREDICRECGGSGRVGDAACPSCKGRGKVIVKVGGA